MHNRIAMRTALHNSEATATPGLRPAFGQPAGAAQQKYFIFCGNEPKLL
jgi:hypothetical protein